MDIVIYGLCTVTAFGCMGLLFRAYRRGGSRLLLWSGLCFAGLTLNNALLVADKWIFPMADLSVPRLAAAFVGMLLLVFGLVWESE